MARWYAFLLILSCIFVLFVLALYRFWKKGKIWSLINTHPDDGIVDLFIACCCPRTFPKVVYMSVQYKFPTLGPRALKVRHPYPLLPCWMFAYLLRMFLLFVCCLGLCPFSGLVCDLLLRQWLRVLTRMRIARRAFQVTIWLCFENTVPCGALPTLVGRWYFTRQYVLWYLKRLDCWDLLARGSMPAHKNDKVLLPISELAINVAGNKKESSTAPPPALSWFHLCLYLFLCWLHLRVLSHQTVVV